MQRWQAQIAAKEHLPETKRRRGPAGQQRRRRLERQVRLRVLAFRRWAQKHRLTEAAVAAQLGIARRTLQRWEARWRVRQLVVGSHGRPARRVSRAIRQQLLAVIELLGPHTGVPILQTFVTEMARREVQDFVRRYRRIWRLRHRRLLHVLHWQRPGTVWAIDFAEPPLPVDGCYTYLLAVRDLSSGMQLLWLPVTDETAQTVSAALQALFYEHGAPLVLKSDNGSGFIADVTATILSEWQVFLLRSPPEQPEYNGACEAGIGSMKIRSHHQAARRESPGQWCSDDVEAARLQANQTARPWGMTGPTPEQCWQQRQPIHVEERGTFVATVCAQQRQARQEQGIPEEGHLTDAAQAALDRVALSRALVAHRLLTFTRESRAVPRPQRAGRKPKGENR